MKIKFNSSNHFNFNKDITKNKTNIKLSKIESLISIQEDLKKEIGDINRSRGSSIQNVKF